MPRGVYIRTLEIKEKTSKSLMGHKSSKKGLTNIELYGEEKAKEIKKNMSKCRVAKEIRICPTCKEEFEIRITIKKIFCCKKCKKVTEESKQRISLANKNRQFTKEHKRKLSISAKGKKFSKETRRKIGKASKLRKIEKMEETGELSWPNYNKEACEFFKSYDEKNNTQGRYAMYGGGEKRINIYWVDYFNEDLKLIIEVDEKHHEKQKEKDAIREKEIRKHYPDFKFLRFKDTEMEKILKINEIGEIINEN